MDNTPATVPAIQKTSPILHTTRRAIATSSMTLGVWSVLVFWWYPFGLMVGLAASTMAMTSIMLGWRAGKEGQHLAWFGLFFGGSGVGLSIASYRFMQLVFEDTIQYWTLPTW